jgi:ATP-binding cassette subfamily B protein
MSTRSQVLVEHHGLATGTELTTWQTLRRGVQLSPELRKGIWVTMLLAVLSTVGRVLVPFVVQRITDDGILAAGGPDMHVVSTYIAIALVGVVVTALSAYLVNVRLFRSSETGLATLRLKAFRHIHDLAMLTQNSERRGSLVSRVTSDVDTISMFVQFGGLMLMINIAQISLATVLMFVYSPILGLVVWLCFVPLFVIIRRFQGIVGRAYTKVRERVGDMLGAISEAVVGAQAIRAYAVEDRTAERIDAAVEASWSRA